MAPIDNAQAFLEKKIDELIDEHGVPGMSAVLVREGGKTIVTRVGGIRKSDVSAGAASNRVLLGDRFNIGSVSKPVSGYLIAFLVQTGVLAWDTTLADVFPELKSIAFRSRYGIRAVYLDKTVEQLMVHHADMPGGPSNGYEVKFDNFKGKFVDEYSTTHSEMLRRYNYTLTALQDPTTTAPGTGTVYGGGSIICGAIAERRTGESYEALMKKHVFDKLSMTHSGFGRIATKPTPDGVWQHAHDPEDDSLTPDTFTTTKAWGFHSHAPAGAVHTSAADMARFISANLPNSGKPKLAVDDSQLVISQQKPHPTESDFARAGWAVHESGNNRYIEHNGDNGVSYAHLRIRPPRNYGLAAMTNVGGANKSTIGSSAVNELIGVLETMNDNWARFSRPTRRSPRERDAAREPGT